MESLKKSILCAYILKHFFSHILRKISKLPPSLFLHQIFLGGQMISNVLEIYNMVLTQSLATLRYYFLSLVTNISFLSNLQIMVWSRHEKRLELTSVPCLAFISTAHSLSTCSSLERCGTCKRLMSIETFRHNQLTDTHYTDISWVDKQHARCRHPAGGRHYCGTTSGIAYR